VNTILPKNPQINALIFRSAKCFPPLITGIDFQKKCLAF
jgi:hypothetical protein